jgi:uncharacterized radical SAM superfamily Fe-S cluster-containing enzyme
VSPCLCGNIILDNNTEIYLNSNIAWCSECQKTELARIVARDSGVFMERVCPANGSKSIKIVNDYTWYLERMGQPQTISTPASVKKIEKGCPHDCGLCEFHTSGIYLPVFSITNDCNLNCPICFTYNRPDQKYYKPIADMQKIVEHILKQAGSVELMNITGGEPTLHPALFDLIETCRHENIGRITMNTNGIRIADDPGFAEKIKASGIQLVFSLDTLDPVKSKLIHGKDITDKKQKALRIIEELNIPTTILPVCIKHVNEDDVAEIVNTYIKKEFVHSITIQNMTFTGRNGSRFQPRDHMTIDEVEQLLVMRGNISQGDFFLLGSYHPLCYSVAYYIIHGEKMISLSRLIDKKVLTQFSQDSYLLNANKDFSIYFREGINRLWAEGEDESFIKVLRNFITELYPPDRAITAQERREIAERMVKMIYIHPHMDEDNFDIDRVSRCGDIVPDESGRMIPACSYNLLHRKHDPRFWVGC